jgi:ferredoxin-nitrate reductase
MITGLEDNEVGLLWIAATNPAVSMPDLERTKKALLASPFTIYQDCYHPTETTFFAHLLLPASQWGEKTGVMTNSERRVTLCQAFREPPGAAKADWEIFAEVGRRLGFGPQFGFTTSAEVFAEFVQLTEGRVCGMNGLSHELLAQAGPQQWPYPGANLYRNQQFPTADGRARFATSHSQGLAEPPDAHYPFVLTNGRLYGHWHTQTRTGRIPKIQQMHPQPFLELHPRDAQNLQLQDADWVLVTSRRGSARFPVRITRNIAPGVAFVPMHWGFLWAEAAEANALTHAQCDPDSGQPELKACAVQLQKLRAEGAPCLDRLAQFAQE